MKEFIANVFDTETTGLIKPSVTDIDQQPYIIEIYVAKMLHKKDGTIEQIDEFDSFVKPPIPISAEITKITGITDSDLVSAPAFLEIFPTLSEFYLGVRRNVAHNLAFDKAMLANDLNRVGKVISFPWPIDDVCTVQKSMHVEQRRMSLTNLHKELFGVEFANAHRAKDDVMALVRCYKEMCFRGWIK